jgi:hypothetical protein
MAQSQLKNSSSNKIAKFLRDRRYRQIVIKNKKAYDRKKHGKTSRYNEDSNSTETTS